MTEGPTADPLAAQEHRALEHPEWLLLAALILDTAGDGPPPVADARLLAKRLDLGASAEQEIALLVGESGLLRSAAARPGALDETRVVPIAAHLRHPERARALLLLSLALGSLDEAGRGWLTELHERVQSVLGERGLLDGEHPSAVDGRLAAATQAAPSRDVSDRLAATPPRYALSQSPAALARQAALLEPVPARGRARVAVEQGGSADTWIVDVACRDQHGLLSRVTRVLAGAGLNVVSAAAATWGDGGAIETFVVRAAGRPDAATLEAAVESGLRSPLSSPAVPEAEVTFDDSASPWYTLCDVRAPDRPGLLHAFATALAVAGANVHGASISTAHGEAVDRFELTDARGRKLAAPAEHAIAATVAAGVPPNGKRRFGRLGKSHSRNIQMTMSKPADPTVGAGL